VVTTSILSTRHRNLKVVERYDAMVTEVPSGLDPNDPARERFDDRSIDVPHDNGSVWIEVRDPEKGELVAIAVFGADAKVVRCDTVEVTLHYRRKGVATALYRLASSLFKAPVVPTDNLSADAVAFWGQQSEIV
jgi:hypothetical protein